MPTKYQRQVHCALLDSYLKYRADFDALKREFALLPISTAYEHFNTRVQVQIAILGDEIVDLVDSKSNDDTLINNRYHTLRRRLRRMVGTMASLKEELEGGNGYVYRETIVWKIIASNEPLVDEDEDVPSEGDENIAIDSHYEGEVCSQRKETSSDGISMTVNHPSRIEESTTEEDEEIQFDSGHSGIQDENRVDKSSPTDRVLAEDIHMDIGDSFKSHETSELEKTNTIDSDNSSADHAAEAPGMVDMLDSRRDLHEIHEKSKFRTKTTKSAGKVRKTWMSRTQIEKEADDDRPVLRTPNTQITPPATSGENKDSNLKANNSVYKQPTSLASFKERILTVYYGRMLGPNASRRNANTIIKLFESDKTASADSVSNEISFGQTNRPESLYKVVYPTSDGHLTNPHTTSNETSKSRLDIYDVAETHTHAGRSQGILKRKKDRLNSLLKRASRKRAAGSFSGGSTNLVELEAVAERKRKSIDRNANISVVANARQTVGGLDGTMEKRNRTLAAVKAHDATAGVTAASPNRAAKVTEDENNCQVQ